MRAPVFLCEDFFDGEGEVGQEVEGVVLSEDVDVVEGEVDGDSFGAGVDEPDLLASGFQAVNYPVLNVRHCFTGRNNFYSQVGRAGKESSFGLFRQIFGLDKDNIRARTVSGFRANRKPVAAVYSFPD